jgi:integrase
MGGKTGARVNGERVHHKKVIGIIEHYTDEQIVDFLAALPDDGLRDFSRWCSACAMRKGEASLLTWNMLEGDLLKIPDTICNNREWRVLPLVGELLAIIERRKILRQMDCAYIFHRDGRQVKECRKTVATARRKANLPMARRDKNVLSFTRCGVSRPQTSFTRKSLRKLR